MEGWGFVKDQTRGERRVLLHRAFKRVYLLSILLSFNVFVCLALYPYTLPTAKMYYYPINLGHMDEEKREREREREERARNEAEK